MTDDMRRTSALMAASLFPSLVRPMRAVAPADAPATSNASIASGRSATTAARTMSTKNTNKTGQLQIISTVRTTRDVKMTNIYTPKQERDSLSPLVDGPRLKSIIERIE